MSVPAGGILATIGAGIAGAFIGGFIGRVLFGPNLTNMWSFVLSVLAAIGVVWLMSGRGRSYGYGRRSSALAYDRGYDDRVVVDDDPPVPPPPPVLLTVAHQPNRPLT